MSDIKKHERLLELLTEEVKIDDKTYNFKEDLEKFYEKGNKAAGTRLRKVMQEVKKTSQEVRNEVQDHKKSL